MGKGKGWGNNVLSQTIQKSPFREKKAEKEEKVPVRPTNTLTSNTVPSVRVKQKKERRKEKKKNHPKKPKSKTTESKMK